MHIFSYVDNKLFDNADTLKSQIVQHEIQILQMRQVNCVLSFVYCTQRKLFPHILYYTMLCAIIWKSGGYKIL